MDDAAEAVQRLSPTDTSYVSALDSIGFNRFSLIIFLLAGLGWISDGAEAAVLSYMLPALRNSTDMFSWPWEPEPSGNSSLDEVQLTISEGELGTLTSALSGAQAVGAVFWGCLADAVGRRPAFIASVGMTAVLGLASAAAPSLFGYVALRAATGFAIGGNLPLAVTVTSELLPLRHRDRALVGLHLFYEVGALSATGLALELMPSSCRPGTPCNWRLFIGLLASPAAVISLLAACILPESPIWLGSRGRHPEAHAVLARALRSSRPTAHASSLDHPWAGTPSSAKDTVDEGEQPRALTGQEASSGGASWTRRLPSALLGGQLRSTTVLVCMLWLCSDAASGWWTWLPDLAALQGVPAKIMYVSSLLGRVAASCAFLLAAALIGCISAHTLLLSCLIASCLLSCLLSVWASSPALFGSPSFVVVYSAFAIFFGALWSLMYVVTPPFFPPTVRASGFGFASAAAKLGQLISPIVAGRLAESSVFAMGSFFTASWASAAVCLALLLMREPLRKCCARLEACARSTRAGAGSATTLPSSLQGACLL